jgi:hypothetical protein
MTVASALPEGLNTQPDSVLAQVKTNLEHLVRTAVTGYVSQPSLRRPGSIPDIDGVSKVLPGMYGVLYNIRVGDAAFGWAGDHVEPGVSIDHPDGGGHHALHYLNCIGNRAKVISGLAKGATGTVVGEHARILVDLEPDTLALLAPGDQVQVESYGQGLKLRDFPAIHLRKCSPQLLAGLPCQVEGGTLRIPVAMTLPIEIMGSGAELNSEYVDQDLMSGDRALMAETGVDQLRLGDFVAIPNADHRYGRGYHPGAMTIALCIHGDSIMTGHGPGILTLMTCVNGQLDYSISSDANIAHYLGLREKA